MINITITKEELDIIKSALQELEKIGGRKSAVSDLFHRLEQLHLKGQNVATNENMAVLRNAWEHLKQVYKWMPGDILDGNGRDAVRILNEHFEKIELFKKGVSRNESNKAID